MTDTSPGIERLTRDKLMAFSGEERFIMGAQMSESAREMVKASLPRACRRWSSDGNCLNVFTARN